MEGLEDHQESLNLRGDESAARDGLSHGAARVLRSSLAPVTCLAVGQLAVAMMGQSFLESTSSIVWVLGVILFVVQCAFSLTTLETIYRLRYENFEGKNLTDFYVASKPVLLLRVLSNVLQFVALLCLCSISQAFLTTHKRHLSISDQRITVVMVMLVAAVDILSVLNIVTMLHQGGGSVKRQRWAGHQLNDILNLTHIVFLVALVSLCCHLHLFHFAYEITVVVIATLIQTYRWVMGGDRGSQLLLVAFYALYLARVVAVGSVFFVQA
jgi:hypothetical protein